MKETGIIMSGDHPRKILDGSKTMTRRTYGLEKINENPDNWEFVYEELGTFYFEPKDKHCIAIMVKCPYGQVGQRLWVRETFFIREQLWVEDHYEPDGRVTYRADLSNPELYKGEWQPSIHMPRWASRITREITGLRAERLQEISPEDAVAEGSEPYFEGNYFFPPKGIFRGLWDSINAKRGYSYDSNPWVWVIGW